MMMPGDGDGDGNDDDDDDDHGPTWPSMASWRLLLLLLPLTSSFLPPSRPASASSLDLTWSDLVCLLRFSADAAADVAQLATAAGLLRQLCVSV